VRFLRSFIILLGILTLHSSLWGQNGPPQRRGSRIIDDTTKQIYGPKTSRYFFEKDVFFNREIYHRIDTSIRDFHRYNYVQRNNNLYQDLGNIGTAMRPIYYQVPEVIGVTSGFQSYDPYWQREEVRYFDTKSPYSNMHVILGGKGRSITRATYSRNINPRWNFGFTYRGLFIDKQIQRQGKGDRNVRSNYYDAYTTFQSKDSTYRLFFNFRRNKMQADEYGGVLLRSNVFADYFNVNAQPSLTQAESDELRSNIHLYHQYKIGGGLQLYHTFDKYRQTNDFLDIAKNNPDTKYYDTTFISRNDSTSDNVRFRSMRNEVGVKGSLLKLFYNGYYALRNYDMHYKYFLPGDIRVKTKGAENYVGGRMSLKLDTLLDVTGWAEIELQSGNFRIDGKLASPWFEASLKQYQYAPSFLLQAYLGGHDAWNNNFNSTNVTQFSGALHYKSSVLKVSPGVTFTRLGNYVFLKQGDYPDNRQSVLPVQTSGQQVILSPELRLGITVLRHVNLKGYFLYTKVLKNPGDAIQIPQMFMNGQLSYENIFFDGNLDMHAGVDFHWKSAYYANAYDVPIQQFYVQQTFKTPAFPLVDLFFDARIKRGRIFVKYNNLIQMITQEGYMLTPRFPGQRNVIDFGFDWSFYD
jgi:hypothetical protein